MSIKTEQIQSADVVSDATGRQYHIALKKGELAEYIILVGEAKRSERASQLLENIRVTQHNREYLTYTGEYKGIPVSIMSTGMGSGCIEIGMIEMFQVTQNPTFIRVGTSGGLHEFINLGDLIISSGAVRLEDTSTYFVHEGYPAIAHHEVILSLIASAEKNKANYHVGLTATASGFYGAQGREIPGIYIRNPHLPEQMAAMNVYNFEMESSTIFNLANMKGFRAGTVCVAIANRPKGSFIAPDDKADAEMLALKTGLDALVNLAKMDKAKANKKHWVPEI